jgi:hypothetical protein
LSTGGARAVERYLKVFSRLESREGSKRPPTPESKSPSGFPALPWEPEDSSEPPFPLLEDADEGFVGEDVPSTFCSGEDDVIGVFVTVTSDGRDKDAEFARPSPRFVWEFDTRLECEANTLVD